jgi:hypothetical protein
MTNRTINIYGAFDRLNYGDLLFPLIIKYCMDKLLIAGDVKYYGTIASDLASYGGVPTRSIRNLSSDLPAIADRTGEDLLIVAGGEVLSATWGDIVGYLMPSDFLRKIEARIRRRIGEKLASWFYAKAFRFPSPLPFVIGDGDYPQVRVLYNAVGGSHLLNSSKYTQTESTHRLKKSSYLSVRDNQTKLLLAEHGCPSAVLSPDSAIVLSDVFPRSVVDQKASARIKSVVRSSEEYVCFQSSDAAARGNESVIADQIIRICDELKVKCIFFDIGTATGHGDQEVVKRMSKLDGLQSIAKFVHCATMFDVMSIISGSKLYLGTSLHGAITALSYDRPVIGLKPSEILKLREFLTTWAHEGTYRLAELSEMSRAASALEACLMPEDIRRSHAQKLKNCVYENFSRMFAGAH